MSAQAPEPGPKTEDGMGKPLDSSTGYYIEDTRSVVGNCVLWWRPNGSGYTCEIDEAGIYESAEVVTMRPTDVAWPVETIRAIVRRHVVKDSLHVIAKRGGK